MNTKEILIGGAILLALPVGLGAYSLFSTVVTAPSRVINKTLQTNNIIFNYELFHDLNQAYIARNKQIVQYKSFYESESSADEKIRLRTELGAMQQSCRDIVAEYNSNTEKMNRSIFKSNNLPTELNNSTCEG